MWMVISGACGRTARALGEYLDGMLPLRRRRAVEAHLRVCAACRGETEAMRRTLSLLHDLPGRELSDRFDAALQARLVGLKEAAPARVPLLSFFRPPARHLRAPWPSPLRILAPAGVLTAAALALAAWNLMPSVQAPLVHHQPPAYVAALVHEHQMLGAGSDMSNTVVRQNLGEDVLGDGDED